MPFRTKICGITTPLDATMVADAGVDAIGLNFYAKSKRFVSTEIASKIVEQLPRCVKRVGVFVNAPPEAVVDIAKSLELDYVQLHGDEPPEYLAELGHLEVIRAIRWRGGIGPLRDYLHACKKKPIAVLVDAYDPVEFGGTGKTLYWPQLADARDVIGELPLILAGGLTPGNVADAIHQAKPFGVDTASGVEKTQPGRKDAALCRRFVDAATSAFGQ